MNNEKNNNKKNEKGETTRWKHNCRSNDKTKTSMDEMSCPYFPDTIMFIQSSYNSLNPFSY